MQTIEFEANIINGVIEVPAKYRDFHDKYAKVSLSVEDDSIQEKEKEAPAEAKEIEMTDVENIDLNFNIAAQALDLSEIKISCFNDVNPVEYQRKIRDAR